MKKIACVLCALLLLMPMLASAEDPATVDIAALMARQVSGNSSFRTQLTAEVSEQTPFFADDESWQALRALLPDLSLESAYVFSRAGETLGNSQLTLYLKRGEDTLSTLRMNGRGDSWQLWGDPLGGVVLVLPRDTALLLRDQYVTLPAWAGVLLRNADSLKTLLSGAGAWPSLSRGLLEGAAADSDWQARLEAALQPYISHLSAWMQARTTLQLARDAAGNRQTVSRMQADLAACGEEARQLLRMLYADEGLLALLRAHMTAEEAAVYLEPGMLPLFEAALAQLPGGDALVLERHYDAEGELVTARMCLPFADGAQCEWEQAGALHTISYSKDEQAARLTVRGSAEEGWQGDFSLTAGEKKVAGQYQLFISQSGLITDLSDAGRERKQNGTITLLLSPAEGQAFPAQSLTIALAATAGAMNSQAARYHITLDWQENGGAFIHVTLKTRTAAAIAQTEPQGTMTAFDALSAEEQKGVIEQAVAQVVTALMAGIE